MDQGVQAFKLPNWADDRLYDYTAKLSRREWAWEFLRRNSEFRTAWEMCRLEYGLTGYDSATTMIVSQHAKPGLAAWGLLHSTKPGQDALSASAFWSPELFAGVLRLTAFPLKAHIDATPFLLRDISCPSILLEMPEGPQHLLFCEGGRGLQLMIEGADIMRPVRLMTNCAPQPDRAAAQLRALQCFNDLRLTGRLYASNVQRDPLSPRLRHVLRVLDGVLAGASRQDIARSLFGDTYTEESSQGRAYFLRDKVRRALRRGISLMRGGYRSLLS